jgi:transposase-like protein
MGKRSYSAEERAACLAALAANAGNVSKTARQCGVPRNTLLTWRMEDEARKAAEGLPEVPKPDPAVKKQEKQAEILRLAEEAKSDLAERFEALAGRLLGVAEDGLEDMKPKDAIVAAAVAVDKMLLLRGEATSITGNADDSRLAAFRARYSTLHAPGHAGANGCAQPVHPPDSEATADPLPRA